MRNMIVSFIIVMFVTPSLLPAQDEPAPAPDLSPMRLVKLKPVAYLYATIPFTPNGLSDAIHQQMVKIRDAAHSAGVSPSGPAMMVFRGSGASPAPTTIDIGLTVPVGTAALPELKVVQTDSALEATAIYTGPVGQANVEELFAEITSTGHTPTNVVRERILYFEDPMSPNNIVLIEIPLLN
jgi:hypothetical protein